MELKFFVESTQKIKNNQREKNSEAERRKTAKVSEQGEQIESINRISENDFAYIANPPCSPCPPRLKPAET
jgi:hypothetical protein